MSVKTTVQVLIGDISANCTVEVVADVKAPVPQAVNDFCAKVVRLPSLLVYTPAESRSFPLQVMAAVIKASNPANDKSTDDVAGVLPFACSEQSQLQRRVPSAPSAFARDSAPGAGAWSDGGTSLDQYPQRGRRDSIEPSDTWPESKKIKLNNGMAHGPPMASQQQAGKKKKKTKGKNRNRIRGTAQNPNLQEVQPDKQNARGYAGGTYTYPVPPPPLNASGAQWNRWRQKNCVSEDTSNRLTPPPPDWFEYALAKSCGVPIPPGLTQDPRFDPDLNAGPAGPMPPALLGLKRKTAPTDTSRPQSAAALPPPRVGLEPARAEASYRMHDEPLKPAAEGNSCDLGNPLPPRNRWLKATSADVAAPLPRSPPPQATFSDPVAMPARANVEGLGHPLPNRPSSSQSCASKDKAAQASDQRSDIWAHRNASLGPSSPENVSIVDMLSRSRFEAARSYF